MGCESREGVAVYLRENVPAFSLQNNGGKC